MIQKKSNRMIMFAVIAVIIVAVPILFFELSDPPDPTITSVNYGVSSDIFYLNLTNSSPKGTFYPGISSSTTFTSSESLNSSLNMSFENISVFYNSCEDYFQLCIANFTISGNINGNLSPTGITVSQIEGAQFPSTIVLSLLLGYEKAINTSKIGTNFGSYNYKFVNYTDMYDGVTQCNVSLLNDTATQHTLFASQKSSKAFAYIFKLSNRIQLHLYPNYYAYNLTKYFLSFTVSLNGLGKTVQTQINIEIIRGNVG